MHAGGMVKIATEKKSGMWHECGFYLDENTEREKKV